MSFTIDRGLFKFDFTDHHAILGIPVSADGKEARKRYLNIARKLHPDSIKAASEAEKKQASQLLSKLVNPAYEQLSQSNNRDYLVSLNHMGRRLATEGRNVPLVSEVAKQLARSGPNLENFYRSSVNRLAAKQYESLDQVLDKIAELSELNMVFLMLKEGALKTDTATKPSGAGVATGAKGAGVTTGTKPSGSGMAAGAKQPGAGFSSEAATGTGSTLPDSTGVSRISEYIRRAEGYMAKNNFAGAVLELREALKLDQNNSRCHTLLGVAYLKQNQATMAKVHINKALQLNPKDELALKGKQHLDALAQKNQGGKQPPKATPGSEQRKQPDQSSGGGLFGKMFGHKKK
ncbi:MAG: DnaJ domain-containing protein [Coleofasciculus sp. Co-bin14]|nr:DnaJ domain-containing protein [Coleofasciculus sp. Co-bin14]